MSIPLMPYWEYKAETDESRLRYGKEIAGIVTRGAGEHLDIDKGFWAHIKGQAGSDYPSQEMAQRYVWQCWLESENGKRWASEWMPQQAAEEGAPEQGPPIDAEARRLEDCAVALMSVVEPAKMRILRYLCDRFGVGDAGCHVSSRDIDLDNARFRVKLAEAQERERAVQVSIVGKLEAELETRVLAERERCAKIAEERGLREVGLYTCQECCEYVASKIRSGE